MGCVQSLFGPSKSRSSSPDREFVPPTFETVPVTRQPKKSIHADDKLEIEDDDDYEDDEADDDDVDEDMVSKCDDFDKYALKGNDGDGLSVHYVHPMAMNTTVDDTGLVAILGTSARCKSAGSSPSNITERPIVGSVSQPLLESQLVKATAARTLVAETASIAVVTFTINPLHEQPIYADCLDKTTDLPLDDHKESVSLDSPLQTYGPPPPTTSPFSPKWPDKWPELGNSNLDRIPVGVIEVLDCEPLDQRRQPSPKAQRFPRSQRSTRDQKVPPPVIHKMEMKPEILDHEKLFKIMTVQPRSTDRQDSRWRPTATGSSTFDSSSRKPFLRQSNQTKEHSKYSNDDYLADTEWLSNIPVFAKCPPAKSKSLPSRELIPLSIPTNVEGVSERQHGVLRGSSLPYDKSSTEKPTESTKRIDEAVIEPIFNKTILVETVTDNLVAIKKPDVKVESNSIDKSDVIDKQNAINQLNASTKLSLVDVSKGSNISTLENKLDKKDELDRKNTPEDNNKTKNDDPSNVKTESGIENTPVEGSNNKNDSEVAFEKREDGSANSTTNSNHTEDPVQEVDTEYRLTMIHSVREAVNRICEQAVERTAAIVMNRFSHKRNSNLTSSIKDRDAENSEADDNASSEFSLPPPPPPPPQHFSDTASTGQESSWPPPPTLSEAEEVKTIGSGFSFDLPDPPTEMDQMDSETDKLDISDEEMRATGLPSDDEDKTDTEPGDGEANHDRPGNEIGIIDAVMKSTASGGSSDGSMEATSIAVVQDNGADDRAATTIQAVYRGFRARKYVEAVNAAAVKIQAGFRGYRVRQSLKNASPSTATTTTDDSQCWSDDDQKSIVSVTYAPLKEYGCESRGAGDGDDGSDDGGHGPSAAGDGDSVSGGGDSVAGGGDSVAGGSDSIAGVASGGDIGVGNDGVSGAAFGGGGVGGIDIYVNDDEDQLQTGDDEVFERDDVGQPAANPTITLSEPTNPTTAENAAEAEALVQAAVKIQARVRGFAVRKRLDDEKKKFDDKQ